MEPIIQYLKRHLRAAGHEHWPAIVEATGIAKTLPRKIAYGDRDNPTLDTIQPLLDYFGAVERGEREPVRCVRPAPEIGAAAATVGAVDCPKRQAA